MSVGKGCIILWMILFMAKLLNRGEDFSTRFLNSFFNSWINSKKVNDYVGMRLLFVSRRQWSYPPIAQSIN